MVVTMFVWYHRMLTQITYVSPRNGSQGRQGGTSFWLSTIRLQLDLRKRRLLSPTKQLQQLYETTVIVFCTTWKQEDFNHAYWFIHEDKAQIQAINPNFVNKQNTERIGKLLDSKSP